jgi:hypothetical protein
LTPGCEPGSAAGSTTPPLPDSWRYCGGVGFPRGGVRPPTDALCYDKKIAEGKTPKEALSALKQQVSDAIYKRLKADAARTEGPEGHAGNDSVASVAGSHPENRLFGQATRGPDPTLRPALRPQIKATSHAGRMTSPTT